MGPDSDGAVTTVTQTEVPIVHGKFSDFFSLYLLLTTAIICVSRFSPNALWISSLRVNMGPFMERANSRPTSFL